MNDQKPPVFKTWSAWYWLILGIMLFQVVLFFWLTRSFS